MRKKCKSILFPVYPLLVLGDRIFLYFNKKSMKKLDKPDKIFSVNEIRRIFYGVPEIQEEIIQLARANTNKYFL